MQYSHQCSVKSYLKPPENSCDTHRLNGKDKNDAEVPGFRGLWAAMQNLNQPIPCICTATAPQGSQAAPSCCAVPPSQPYSLHHRSKLRQGDSLHSACHSHSPGAGAGLDRVMESWLKTQIRHPRTGRCKLNLQRALHLHCLHILGQVSSLYPVSTWPGAACRTPQSEGHLSLS